VGTRSSSSPIKEKRTLCKDYRYSIIQTNETLTGTLNFRVDDYGTKLRKYPIHAILKKVHHLFKKNVNLFCLVLHFIIVNYVFVDTYRIDNFRHIQNRYRTQYKLDIYDQTHAFVFICPIFVYRQYRVTLLVHCLVCKIEIKNHPIK
jgi:hypothetical protein